MSEPRRRPVALLALALVFAVGGVVWWSQGTGESKPPGEPARASVLARPIPAGPEPAAAGTAQLPADVRGSDSGVDAGPSSTPDGSLLLGEAEARAAITAWLAQNAALAEKYVDVFCEEHRQLQRAPPSTSGARQHDASSLMTVRIDWEDNVRPPGLLHLPEPLRQRLKGYGDDWPRLITDQDLAGLDFSWMTQLHAFDHWNVLAEGPLRDARDHDFYQAPIPNFIVLQYWTRLRLARAFRDRDFAGASSDVHQLAAILRSMGILIADMVAVALLNIERTALEAAAAQGLEVPPGLSYPAEETARERRLARSGMYFFLPGVPEAVMAKAFACDPEWRCSALAEGYGAHTTLEELTDDSTGGVISALVEESGCTPEMMKWIRKSAPHSAEQGLAQLGSGQPLLQFFGPDAGR